MAQWGPRLTTSGGNLAGVSGPRSRGARNGKVSVRSKERSFEMAARSSGVRGHLDAAAIVQSSRDAIIGASIDGTISSWNAAAAELYAITAERAIGRSLETVLSIDGGVAGILERLVAGEKIADFETVST